MRYLIRLTQSLHRQRPAVTIRPSSTVNPNLRQMNSFFDYAPAQNGRIFHPIVSYSQAMRIRAGSYARKQCETVCAVRPPYGLTTRLSRLLEPMPEHLCTLQIAISLTPNRLFDLRTTTPTSPNRLSDLRTTTPTSPNRLSDLRYTTPTLQNRLFDLRYATPTLQNRLFALRYTAPTVFVRFLLRSRRTLCYGGSVL